MNINILGRAIWSFERNQGSCLHHQSSPTLYLTERRRPPLFSQGQGQGQSVSADENCNNTAEISRYFYLGFGSEVWTRPKICTLSISWPHTTSWTEEKGILGIKRMWQIDSNHYFIFLKHNHFIHYLICWEWMPDILICYWYKNHILLIGTSTGYVYKCPIFPSISSSPTF